MQRNRPLRTLTGLQGDQQIGEVEALRSKVVALERELQVTKEELAIQQSKLDLEIQHTQLLKRKYEDPCPD